MRLFIHKGAQYLFSNKFNTRIDYIPQPACSLLIALVVKQSTILFYASSPVEHERLSPPRTKNSSSEEKRVLSARSRH